MIRIIEEIERFNRESSLGDQEYVKCKVQDMQNQDQTYLCTLHRDEFELIKLLNHFAIAMKLPEPTIKEIWNKIEAYGNMKYAKGLNDIG